jgi:hypothetical protein
MMSIDDFGGKERSGLPPTSSIRQKKIEQNGKKQHKKTAIALVDLGPKTEIYPSCPSCQNKIEQNREIHNTKKRQKNGHLP